MYSTMFGRNWPNVLGEKDFIILTMYFAITLLSPLAKRRGHSLQQTLHKVAFCQVLIEIDSAVILRKNQI